MNPLEIFEVTGLDGVPELMCYDCPDFFYICYLTLPEVIEIAESHVKEKHNDQSE